MVGKVVMGVELKEVVADGKLSIPKSGEEGVADVVELRPSIKAPPDPICNEGVTDVDVGDGVLEDRVVEDETGRDKTAEDLVLDDVLVVGLLLVIPLVKLASWPIGPLGGVADSGPSWI